MIYMKAANYSLNADRYYVERTYGGLLEGLPSQRTNKFIIDRLPGACERIFGGWPVAILPTSVTRSDEWAQRTGREALYLPSYWIAAEFKSQAIDPRFDGSVAIVCWFQNEAWPLLSEENVARAAALDWASFARDFDN